MLKYQEIKFYNTKVKIAGDTITLKSFSETKAYNYQVKMASAYKEEHQEKAIVFDVFGYAKVNMKPFNYIENIKSKVKRIFEEVGKELQKKERFEKTNRRAKEKIYDYIACNVGKHLDHEGKKQRLKFFTLSFHANIQDISAANMELQKYLKRLSYHLYGVRKNVIKYIAIPELQQRGALHFHIVIFNMKPVPATMETAEKWKKEGKLEEDYNINVNLLDLWEVGGVFINAINTKDIHAIASYVTKYISKGIEVDEKKGTSSINQEQENKGEKRLFDYDNYKKYKMENKKRYYVSRGLIRPREYYLHIENGQAKKLIEGIAEETKKYKNKEGEIKVNYHEAIYNYEYEYKGQLRKETMLIVKARIKLKKIEELKAELQASEFKSIREYAKEKRLNYKKAKNIMEKYDIRRFGDLEKMKWKDRRRFEFYKANAIICKMKREGIVKWETA